MPMRVPAVLRIVAMVAASLTALALRAHACQFPVTDIFEGVIDGWQQSGLPPIPRNAAFVWSHGDGSGAMPTGPVEVAVDATTSHPIMGHVVKAIGNRPGTFVAKPDEPMPAHLVILSGGAQSAIGDYLDEAPPDTPQIIESSVRHDDGGEGCAGGASSCAGFTNLGVTLSAPAKDDHTPAERIAYLVYLERSAETTRTTRTPFALVSAAGTINQATLFVSLDPSWADSDAFVSVSAIDWAGNESPRTEPYQANSSGIGCAVSLSRRYRPRFSIIFATLTALACLRKWKRRRSYGAS
jgi:hypothetical protein